MPADPSLTPLRDLQRCLNDLVTLLAFPAMWAGRSPSQILSYFADGLLRLLQLDVIYVRLTDKSAEPSECFRASAEMQSHPDLRHELLAALDGESSDWPRRVPLGTDGRTVSIEPVRLGVHAQRGVMLAGSSRPDFPLQTEQLLMSVATNQLVMALQESQIRLEQALLAREREFTQIVNTIPALVWCARPDGSAIFFSESYLAYVGLAAEELLNWGWTTVVHPDDLNTLLAVWSSMRSVATPVEAEARLRRLDGVYRWFLLRGNPVIDESGQVVKWYGINTDIDARKSAEEALSIARSELATVARETSLGVLTAAIAHEVNQPISGIITNAGACMRMLSSRPPNVDGAIETARRTIRDGNRAAEVIARLRTLYTRRDIQLEPLDLNDATREVVSLSLRELQRNGVVLRHELASDLPLVKGDRIQLQQVILNLLRNASDAMRTIEDRPREVLVGTGPDATGQVRLSVKDTGIGLSDEAVAKLFEPFHTTKADGMGIGLSVSRSIIEAHGGRLWVVPNEGPGITFSFALPCGDSP